MKLPPSRRSNIKGYSLVEVLVASGILMLGISAACVMSLAMVTQEEINYRVSRALNLQENAGRLYHLGLNWSEISNGPNAILPSSEDVLLEGNPGSANLPGVGQVNSLTITARIAAAGAAPSNAPQHQDFWTGGRHLMSGSASWRPNVIVVYRPNSGLP